MNCIRQLKMNQFKLFKMIFILKKQKEMCTLHVIYTITIICTYIQAYIFLPCDTINCETDPEM